MKSFIQSALLSGMIWAFGSTAFGQAPPDAPPLSPDPPTTGNPNRRPSDAAANSPFQGKEWQLTPYLKGTAAQIRDKLNGEMERLILKINETQGAIKSAGTDEVNDQKGAVDAVRQTKEYKQTAAERAKAEQDLEAARKGGSPQDRIDASTRFNKARMAIEKMEHDAVTKCEALSLDRHKAYELEHDLKRYNEALGKATSWREELLDATRNAFMVQGQMQGGHNTVVGQKGILPRVTVYKVVDPSHVIVDYELVTFDRDRPMGEKEGMKIFQTSTQRIKILVSGVGASNLKFNQKLNFDRSFVIDGQQHSENQGTIYTASPAPSENDYLFETIVPIRQTLNSPPAN